MATVGNEQRWEKSELREKLDESSVWEREGGDLGGVMVAEMVGGGQIRYIFYR